MPQMGVSVAEGTVVAWHKRVGDWVTADETVCEISTDKIDTEVPAPTAGRLAEILVEVGATVDVGTVLARIAVDAVAGEPHPDEADIAAAAAAPVANGSALAPERPVRDAGTPGAGRRYSPVVQRIAEAEGVELSQVTGTGRGGRVRKQDVLAHVAGAGAAGTAAAEPPLHIESPYREEPSPELTATAAAGSAALPADGDVVEPLSRMRRSIAEHMLRSLHTAATCTSITEADMSAIEVARRALGASYLPFVARAAVDALRAHPQLNCTLEGETLTRHAAVHLGIAVSLGEGGLIVPVMHDAHELSHEGLAARIRELARRARSGELSPDEVRGGTFTITNPGGYGTIASTPIINQPQVAILDLEAVVKRAVVIDGPGGESIAIRPMTNLCLSWDHRALDGALAAQFLATLRERLENWKA